MSYRSLRRIWARVLRSKVIGVVALATGLLGIAHAGTQYLYDDLGRLILAVNSDGSAALYEHDPNGNLTAIHQWAGSAPIVAAFSPSSGPVGSQVTISGAGFDPSTGGNTVTIGGAAATVGTATSSTLVVTVPSTAVSGPIAVSVSGVTGTSAATFVVRRPSIAGFSPSVVNPGNAVTVTGTNLNLVPGSTSVSVGGTVATLTSLTNSQVVFNAPATSGPIVINTSYGQAQSATALFVVPSAIAAANVVGITHVEPGGLAQNVSINQQNKYGLFEFDAGVGQWLSVQTSALTTTPAGANVGYQVFSPSGGLIASGSISGSRNSIHLPVIASPGKYLVAFASGSSSSVQVSALVEVNATLGGGATVSSSTVTSGVSKRFIFSATAGDDLGLAVTSVSFTPTASSGVQVYVDRPNGSNWQYTWCGNTEVPGCVLSLLNVPDTGQYVVRVMEASNRAMSFGITLSTDVTGTLTAGVPLDVNLDVPGRQALLGFTATAGQSATLSMASISTTPTGKSVFMYVYNPSGTQVASTSGTTQATLNLTNLVAGTYSVLIQPQKAATSTLQVQIQ